MAYERHRVSGRSGLPIPFLVGIFSAVALGVVWGLVYFSIPTPAPPVVARVPRPSPPPPSFPLSSDRPPTVPPLPSSAAPLLSPARSSPLPPDETINAPPIAVPRSTKTPSSKPRSAEQPAAPAPVPADDLPALQGVSPACIVELEKLCEGTQPGEPRRTCFKENETRLSPACRRQVNEMAARIKEDMQHFRTACAGDVKQFCPTVVPGGGNILQCLEENYKDVSENCYQALKRFKQMKAGRSL